MTDRFGPHDELMKEHMSRIEDSLIAGLCPDCNHRGFVFDWGNGDSRNIECASASSAARPADHFLGLPHAQAIGRWPGMAMRPHPEDMN